MLISSHQKCLPLLYFTQTLNQYLTPCPRCHIFFILILPFFNFLNHDSLLILFYLYEITLFISCIDVVLQIIRDRVQGDLMPIHRTEYFRQWKMSSWISVDFKEIQLSTLPPPEFLSYIFTKNMLSLKIQCVYFSGTSKKRVVPRGDLRNCFMKNVGS